MADTETGMDENTETTEQPEVPEGRAALVKQMIEKVQKGRDHFDKTFKAMKVSQDFARYGSDREWRESGKYAVPILPRYINQTVSNLYAKNPKTVFKRRPRLDYQLWDGRSDTLQAAMQMAQQGDQQSMMLIQEVLSVRQHNTMLDRMGMTAQILYQYFLDEQGANFKQQLKAAVRRSKTCKVAWIKIGFQRQLEERPEVSQGIADSTSKLAEIQAALQKIADGDPAYDETSAEAEKLRLNLQDLQRDQFIAAREGLVFDFPKSDQIIVDPKCTHLKSLTGAEWVAHMFEMDKDDILETWKVDVGSDFTAYDRDGKPYDGDKEKACARVFQVWDIENQQVSVVCEGYKDFLEEPHTPDVWIERFWPFFPIVFNETEHYEEIYPLSDVEQAKDIQEEYNRSREALREHRIAARPYWVEGIGLSDEEKANLSNHPAHAVVSLPTLGTGQKVEDLLQRGPTAPIDPNLYELESHFTDLTRVVGYQEAQFGSVSGATATESSIAQHSQSASQSDNVDDLDEVLTELAKAGGQILFTQMSKDKVIEIVGEGAVWPDTPMTREEAAKEIYLETEAGSSGRPNKAADLANMERGMPFLLQLPDLKPQPIAKKYLSLLDIDVDEAIADGVPSITALNAIIAKMGANQGAQPTGDPRTDPNSQGAEGAQNAPSTESGGPGPQPAYPAPSA